MVELDEMYSYIGNKETIVGYGLLLIDMGKRFINFVIGDRSNKTEKQLWKEIEHHKMSSPTLMIQF